MRIPLRILFSTANPLTRSLGAPKVVIELAEALRGCGCVCDLLNPGALGLVDVPVTPALAASYSRALLVHLKRVVDDYDVVDVDHEFLPFPRSELPWTTLIVARSILLNHHFMHIHPPKPRSWRGFVGSLVHGRSRSRDLAARISSADRTMAAADLVNLANARDMELLIGRGIDPSKIVVIPYGLTQAAFGRFAAVTTVKPPPVPPCIAFVGTFDYRKGAADFPRIVSGILHAHPSARFLLIGTGGMIATAQGVLDRFPAAIRSAISVHPKFDPDALPGLLSGCVAGVFPSYLESFGFGALEMLAAHLPVIAYDSPGPSSIVPADWLVPPGDAHGLAAKISALLRLDDADLADQRRRARAVAEQFTWESAAQRTESAYRSARERLLQRSSAGARQ